MSPRYGDGYSSPTISITGHELPNSRLVSIVAFGEADVPDPQFTLVRKLLMRMKQFFSSAMHQYKPFSNDISPIYEYILIRQVFVLVKFYDISLI